MNITKVVRITGYYFIREYEKGKKPNKYRELTESTVLKSFLKDDCEITVVFEESDREPIIINPSSDRDIIKRYLGDKFLG